MSISDKKDLKERFLIRFRVKTKPNTVSFEKAASVISHKIVNGKRVKIRVNGIEKSISLDSKEIQVS